MTYITLNTQKGATEEPSTEETLSAVQLSLPYEVSVSCSYSFQNPIAVCQQLFNSLNECVTFPRKCTTF
jgi:hypothetical protein